MSRPAIAPQFILGLTLVATTCATPVRYEQTQTHMGTRFRIVLYATDMATANRALQDAFHRISELDQTLSDYKPDSEVSRLNRIWKSESPSRAVHVSDDLWAMLAFSEVVSRQVDGAFDITMGPLTKIWRRARRRRELPRDAEVQRLRQSVGFQLLILDNANRSVDARRNGIRLDFGAVAKGFAADEALAVLKRHNIHQVMVDAGGDLALGDAPPERAGWRIGLQNLEDESKNETTPYLLLSNAGVATSGDTWQYLEIDDKRYSHIIDPRTGYGVTNRCLVTVVSTSCALADAWASAISVLGPDPGLARINREPGIDAFIQYLDDGRIIMRQSKNAPAIREWNSTEP